MTDREMLELAAKAGGYARHEYVENSAMDGRVVTGHYDSLLEVCINPLTDDGDALRLAVKLGIEVWRVPGKAMANGPRISPRISEPNGSDIYAATRRAITRAAAEIGRQMEVTT